MWSVYLLVGIFLGCVGWSMWCLRKARQLICGKWTFISDETPKLLIELELVPTRNIFYIFPLTTTVASGIMTLSDGSTSKINIHGTVSITDPRVIYNATVSSSILDPVEFPKYRDMMIRRDCYAVIINRDERGIMEWIGTHGSTNWKK